MIRTIIVSGRKRIRGEVKRGKKLRSDWAGLEHFLDVRSLI